MIENNPREAAGSCQETGAGGHAGDDEADACRCAQCGAATIGQDFGRALASSFRAALNQTYEQVTAGLDAAAASAALGNRGRSTLEILADHWPSVRPGS